MTIRQLSSDFQQAIHDFFDAVYAYITSSLTGLQGIEDAIDAFATQNNTDLGTLNTTVGTVDTSVNAFATQNTTDLGTLNTTVGTVNTSVNSFASQNNTDLGTLNTSVGTVNTSVNSFATQNSTDLGTLNTSVGTVDTSINSFALQNSTDLTTLANKGFYTIYDEQLTVNFVPIVQNTAISRQLNSTLYRTFTAGGGTVQVDMTDGSIVLSTSTTVGSFALVRSKRPLTYRAGFTMICRFASIFSTPVAASLQFSGVGNSNSDIYIGYSGTEFGVRYSTGGNLESHDLVLTNASNNTSTVNVTLNSVLYNIPVTNAGGDIAFTAYQISTFAGFGGLWSTSFEDNTVTFIASAVGIRGGSYGVVFNNATAGALTQKITGSSLSTTFVALVDCNGDSDLIATLNPQTYNMYQILYSWYGSSPFQLGALSPSENKYKVLHTFRFNNQQTSPSLTYPQMYIQRFVASLGSTSVITKKTLGSFGAYLGNAREYGVEPNVSVSNNKAFNNSNVPIIALRHRSYISGAPIQPEFTLGFLSLANVGAKPSIIRVIRNPTTIGAGIVSNYTEWNPVYAESITLIDINATTYSGGAVLFTLILGAEDTQVINLGRSGIFFGQGDSLVIAAENAQTTEVYASVQIIEEIV